MAKVARPKEFPLAVMLALVCLTASAQTPSPAPKPQTPQPTPQITPAPQITQPAPQITQPSAVAAQLSLDEVLRLANAQASSFQSAAINERIAAEDVQI